MLAPILEFAETADHWRLATYHYPQKGRRRHPVILVHGLGSNRFDLDFPDPRLSLAKFLHRQGYDTWVIELRGAGKSHQGGVVRRNLARWRARWDFDDYIFRDLPALAALIRKKTGRKKFHWIGHSLGGTIVYAALETLGSETIASGVTLGAAMSASAKPGFIRWLLKFDPLYKTIPFLPVKTLARAGSCFAEWLVPMEDNQYYARGNIDPKTIRAGLRNAVENISTTLFLQLHDWYKNNHFQSHERKFSFRNNLKKIKAPVLVCAGSVDRLTPYPDVHSGYREIGSRRKKFVVFGRDHGCRTEYAHLDLLWGKNAPREVFPVIADWLDQHD